MYYALVCFSSWTWIYHEAAAKEDKEGKPIDNRENMSQDVFLPVTVSKASFRKSHGSAL